MGQDCGDFSGCLLGVGLLSKLFQTGLELTTQFRDNCLYSCGLVL